MLTVDARFINQSGIGRYLAEVLPRVIEGLESEVTLLGGEAAREMAGATGAAYVPLEAPMYSLAEQYRLKRAIPRASTLFWAPHYNIPLAWRGRLLVTVHDLLHLARPEFVRGAHRRLYAGTVFRRLARRADRVICVSHFTAREMERLLGVHPYLTRVIHQGVSEAWFQPADPEPPHPRPYLLYVGNVKPHKNLGRLVQAFARLTDEIEHDLLIAGRREGFITGDAAVERAAAALGDRVRFTGELGDAELRRHLAHAEALVFPSLYEGFGLPPLEAMAAGCPVLAARAASIPEACGGAALYFDPMDVGEIAKSIRSIIARPELREQLRARGTEHARTFTWDRSAAATRDVIHDLIAR